MAVDEALLDSYAASEAPLAPTLRLYGWAPAAFSLGRSQPARGSFDPRFLSDEGIGLVRRPSGGFAVLHERERTYAVAARLGSEPFPGGVLDAYRRIAAALEAALARLGLDAEPAPAARRGTPSTPLCHEWSGPYELEAKGSKLVGSAQRRRRRGMLQHGSIPLRLDAARLRRAAALVEDARRPLRGLEDLLGRPVGPGELDAAIAAGFEEAFGGRLVPGDLTAEEAARAGQLARLKYGTSTWTFEGRLDEDARRAGLVA